MFHCIDIHNWLKQFCSDLHCCFQFFLWHMTLSEESCAYIFKTLCRYSYGYISKIPWSKGIYITHFDIARLPLQRLYRFTLLSAMYEGAKNVLLNLITFTIVFCVTIFFFFFSPMNSLSYLLLIVLFGNWFLFLSICRSSSYILGNWHCRLSCKCFSPIC